MTKLIFTMAAGSALLLVSCEPIPIHPSQRKYPNGPRQQPELENPKDGENEVIKPPTRNDYPVAERTANPNFVISPYPPYNVIDIQGFRSGQLAKDTSNDKIFRIP